MQDKDKKQKQDKRIVHEMIVINCKGNHKEAFHTAGGLCPACQELDDYATLRSDRCPRKEERIFCSTCPTHCYNQTKREEIRRVMRYAGPRIMRHHPIMGIKHLLAHVSHKRPEDKVD